MKSQVIESLNSKFTIDTLNENLKLLEFENEGFKDLITEYKILIENFISQKGLFLNKFFRRKRHKRWKYYFDPK